MERRRFLAFDLGAESGRAVVGTLEEGRLSLEEIHRFPNEPVEVGDTLYWDVLGLYGNVLTGMREYRRRFGESVDGIGIDTWGVDFGLLAADGRLLQNPVHYRDRRTEGILEQLHHRMPAQELFERTGVGIFPISTLCQLLSLRLSESPLLETATTLLMMPDLLAYFLTGKKAGERTNATTTQLYDPGKCRWSEEVFRALDLPLPIMPEVVQPGTMLAGLRASVADDVGLKHAPVIAPCTHDTASAVAAVPAEADDWAFLSSGTWSVLGAPGERVVTSREACSAGVLNEATLEGFYLCHNIMGLWLLQQARVAWEQDLGKVYSYEELIELARQTTGGGPLLHPDDPAFLAPRNMVQSIRDYCAKTEQPQPEGPGEVTRCILESLALSYRHGLERLSQILGYRFRVLHIVGGGSRNSLLCQFTADATGIPALAGPVEATVAGNVLVQALATGGLSSPTEVRAVVRRSTDLIEYKPHDTAVWQDRYADYLQLLERVSR